MELKVIFAPYTQSIFDIFAEQGTGFYIPSYQRPYSWKVENVEKLFDDVMSGIKDFVKNPDSAVFIGTFILVRDSNHESIDPIDHEHLPTGIYLLIDGQQRMTTIFIFLTMLYKAINDLKDLSPKLEDKRQEILGDVSKILWFNPSNSRETNIFKYYPTLVKALDDLWSRNETRAKYTSSIGKLIFSFIRHVENGEDFVKIENILNEEKDSLILDACKFLRSGLDQTSKAKDEDFDLLNIGEDRINLLIWNSNLQESFDWSEKDKKALRLFIFAKYFLTRVAITKVVAKDEQYAFDMFESLNTTGQQLTSLETFKPIVIKHVQQKNWERSESKKYYDKIQSFLTFREKNSKKEDAKLIATNDLLISCAQGENAEKLSKRLSDQRQFLKNYSKQSTDQAKEYFLRHMSTYAEFIELVWDADNITVIEFVSTSEKSEFEFFIKVLKDCNMAMPISILARYYHSYLYNNITSTELLQALKSIVAFFVLYRSSRESTDGIDKKFRDLFVARGFSRKDSEFPANIIDLKNILKEFLDDQRINCLDKEKYIQKFSEVNSYKAKHLSKLCLFIAHDNSEVDNLRIVKCDRVDQFYQTLFNVELWSSTNFQIEHIAPDNPVADEWSSDIYADDFMKDKIGNLTLLPGILNASIQNISQLKKWKAYKLIGAKTKEEQERYFLDLGEIDLKKSREEILRDSKYFPFISSIYNNPTWNKQTIEARSFNLGELVHSTVIKWLE